MLGPIVVFQYGDTIERHIFPDGDAFIAWIDSQETSVNVDIEPREEFIDVRPANVRNPQDYCPGCKRKVPDFEADGFENEKGQRGHYRCVPHLAPGRS